MDFKVTLGMCNAKDKTDAEIAVNEMLDAYEFRNFTDVEINWLDTDEGELKPM